MDLEVLVSISSQSCPLSMALDSIPLLTIKLHTTLCTKLSITLT